MDYQLRVLRFATVLLCSVAKVGRVVPVVVGFKRTVLIEAQVLRLLIRKLCQVGLKRGQMQTGDIFI